MISFWRGKTWKRGARTCLPRGAMASSPFGTPRERDRCPHRECHGGCAVNFVEWNVEGDINQIVTSAFDDSINLWDVRRVDEESRFNAHKRSEFKNTRCYIVQLLHSTEERLWQLVKVPALTIYDIENKRKCSGDIGFDSTTLTCLSGGRVAAANKREISIFLPIVCWKVCDHSERNLAGTTVSLETLDDSSSSSSSNAEILYNTLKQAAKLFSSLIILFLIFSRLDSNLNFSNPL